MTIDPKKIADLITEDPNVPAGDAGGESLDPNRFIEGVNGIIASAPHGRQQEVLKRAIEMGENNPEQLITLLSSAEPTHNTKYLQDFYRSKGSNIMWVAKLAQIFYDEETVMHILDDIRLDSEFTEKEDEEEDELYNSEGDGYSH